MEATQLEDIEFKCQYVCLKTKNFVFQSIP